MTPSPLASCSLEVQVLNLVYGLGWVLWCPSPSFSNKPKAPIRLEGSLIEYKLWRRLLIDLTAAGYLERERRRAYSPERKTITTYKLSLRGRQFLESLRP